MSNDSKANIWSVVHRERETLARDLESLEAGQWGIASLCPGWDIHDVLAHLLDSATTTRLGFIRRMLAAGFDFDKDNAKGVAAQRRADPLETLQAFRDAASLTSTPPAALATRLVEAFVHGEDIRRPLGMRHNYPADVVARAVEHQVRTSTKMGGGKEFAAGFRLVATDTAFDCGSGPEIRGPAIALLLSVSGRAPGYEELAGPGSRDFLQRAVG